MKNYTLKIKKLNPDAIIPDYAHEGDAGLDLYSVEDMVIEPFEFKLVKTGFAIELPHGTEAQIRSKSGIALNSGVFVLNSPGTIDENYKGEIGVILYNLNKNKPFVIKKGQKVAQMVIAEVQYVNTCQVEEISQSSRGTGAFGSTGLGQNKK